MLSRGGTGKAKSYDTPSLSDMQEVEVREGEV